MFAFLWRHRNLVFELTKRDFTGRYKGSFGGILWSFLQPLFLLAVYTIAFGVILKTRWGASDNTTDYALMLFSGLIIFNLFSEVLNRSSTLITENPNYVKKIVFPLELLSIITTTTALIHAFVGVFVWLLACTFIIGTIKITALLFPIIFITFIPILLGIGWLLSCVGVVIKDVSQLTAMLSHILLFLTPIFYSIDSIPEFLKRILMINPLTFIIEQLRLILIHGNLPNFYKLAIYFILSSIFAWMSLILFKKIRPNFADMI